MYKLLTSQLDRSSLTGMEISEQQEEGKEWEAPRQGSGSKATSAASCSGRPVSKAKCKPSVKRASHGNDEDEKGTGKKTKTTAFQRLQSEKELETSGDLFKALSELQRKFEQSLASGSKQEAVLHDSEWAWSKSRLEDRRARHQAEPQKFLLIQSVSHLKKSYSEKDLAQRVKRDGDPILLACSKLDSAIAALQCLQKARTLLLSWGVGLRLLPLTALHHSTYSCCPGSEPAAIEYVASFNIQL
eukprot:6468348-Amphidinium_carterae.1